MKIHDISQDIFNAILYPGDPSPKGEFIAEINKSSSYNLSIFSMCSHNGTHIDAPFHYLNEGKKVDEIRLDKFIGLAYVIALNGNITKELAINLVLKIKSINNESLKRLLIKGNAIITLEAAKILSKEILLVGTELISVGPIDDPDEVHKELLRNEIAILEGIRLNGIKEGIYFLSAAPIKLSGLEGAPCRAILIESEMFIK